MAGSFFWFFSHFCFGACLGLGHEKRVSVLLTGVPDIEFLPFPLLPLPPLTPSPLVCIIKIIDQTRGFIALSKCLLSFMGRVCLCMAFTMCPLANVGSKLDFHLFALQYDMLGGSKISIFWDGERSACAPSFVNPCYLLGMKELFSWYRWDNVEWHSFVCQ